MLLEQQGLPRLTFWISTEAATTDAADVDEERYEVIGASNSFFDWQCSLSPTTSTSSSSLDAPAPSAHPEFSFIG